jgi:hypothetical protein
VTKTQPFLIDGYYRTNIISVCKPPEVIFGHAASVMYGSCAMAGAPTLYYRSLGTTSTLLRKSNILGKP